jgi:hydroxyacylglutathione hydrolase
MIFSICYGNANGHANSRVLPVLKQLESSGEIKLTSLINTHHHYDHAGGNEEMLKAYTGLPVIAGRDSPCVTKTPPHKSSFNIGKNIKVTALHTPCHTQDSICYFMEDSTTNERVVFTGDTLFIAGCGRFFEGTADEMLAALNTLASLPDDTKIYPGHEYTKGNLKFVKTVLENDAVKKLDNYTKQHENTTGVFTIGEEKEYNPFMRSDDQQIQLKVGESDPISTMAKLRELKNKL